jgi:integrase/recombinase XerD
MELRAHGVDQSVIALWLGHESVETTQMYLHADLRVKEQALSRVEPLGIKPARDLVQAARPPGIIRDPA